MDPDSTIDKTEKSLLNMLCYDHQINRFLDCLVKVARSFSMSTTGASTPAPTKQDDAERTNQYVLSMSNPNFDLWYLTKTVRTSVLSEKQDHETFH